VLQRKLRRATMYRGGSSSARKNVNLIPILKSSSVVVGCWPASLPVLVNVGDVMGKLLVKLKGCRSDLCMSFVLPVV
jgi:hypothetical protein